MATLITKSIGATARDYATIALWEADIPADLTSTDEIWRGECYNDAEFTQSGEIVIDGHITDATRYIELTTATGESFRDHADVLTNALTYNISNGVGIRKTGSYSTVIGLDDNFIRVSNLQFSTGTGTLNAGSLRTGSGANNILIRDCIFQSSGNANVVRFAGSGSTGKIINCTVVVTPGGSITTIGIEASFDAPLIINCTVICLFPGSTGIGINKNGSSADSTIVKNTVILGFGTAMDTGAWGAGTDYNATDDTTLPVGSNNLTSLTAANQIENISDLASLDMRVKTGSDIEGEGLRDASNTNDLDIIGQDRSIGVSPNGPTIGAWEFQVVAGGWTGIINGVTNPSKINGILVANIIKVNGIT